jgi:uncharacterized membrane protein YecN with MAPEG domain
MLIAVCVLFAVDFVHEKGISIEAVTAAKVNIVVRWTCYIVLTMLILWVLVDRYGQAASTFIYARF